MSTETTVGREPGHPQPGTGVGGPVHSNAEFAVKHMGIAMVRGNPSPTSRARFEVAETLSCSAAFGKVMVVSSSPTTTARRHLRSPDFFDVASYPDHFESTRVQVSMSTRRGYGNLTMQWRHREIKLDVGGVRDRTATRGQDAGRPGRWG